MERQQKEYSNEDRSVKCTGNYSWENVISFKLEKLRWGGEPKPNPNKQKTHQTQNLERTCFFYSINTTSMTRCIESSELIVSRHTNQSVLSTENVFHNSKRNMLRILSIAISLSIENVLHFAELWFTSKWTDRRLKNKKLPTYFRESSSKFILHFLTNKNKRTKKGKMSK